MSFHAAGSLPMRAGVYREVSPTGSELPQPLTVHAEPGRQLPETTRPGRYWQSVDTGETR